MGKKYYWSDENSTYRIAGKDDPIRFGDEIPSKGVDVARLVKLGKVSEDPRVALNRDCTDPKEGQIDALKAVHAEEVKALREENESLKSENDSLSEVVDELTGENSCLREEIAGLKESADSDSEKDSDKKESGKKGAKDVAAPAGPSKGGK